MHGYPAHTGSGRGMKVSASIAGCCANNHMKFQAYSYYGLEVMSDLFITYAILKGCGCSFYPKSMAGGQIKKFSGLAQTPLCDLVKFNSCKNPCCMPALVEYCVPTTKL